MKFILKVFYLFCLAIVTAVNDIFFLLRNLVFWDKIILFSFQNEVFIIFRQKKLREENIKICS